MSRPANLPIRLASNCTRQFPRPLYYQTRVSTCPHDPKPQHRQWRSRQPFSTTPKRPAGATMKAVKPVVKSAATPSLARTQKEQQAQAMASGNLPDDVGLLPDTFILPRNLSERWSWRLRRKWLKVRFWETLSAAIFKLYQVRPRPKLGLFEAPNVAKDLHEKIYTAFASGDLKPVQPYIASGLLSSLRARLTQRAPNTYLSWTVLRHLSPPKLVSYKAAQFPGPKNETAHDRNAQIQAVVRLHTLQSLQNIHKVSKRVQGRLVVEEKALQDPHKKESWEYIVLQRTVRKGKWGDWAVWGFAEETSVAKIKYEAAKSAST